MSDYTLPPVPDHPFANSLSERWSEMEEVAIERYGHAVAAPLIARVAELESLLSEVISDTADELGCAADNELILLTANRLRAEVEALRALLDGAAKTRAPKPRTLPTVGTGALHGEQQYCFEKGYREGASAVRKAIAVKVAAIAARKGEENTPE